MTTKVNSEVRRILEGCIKSKSPLVCLAAELARLAKDPDWKPDEIEQVQKAAAEALQGLLS